MVLFGLDINLWLAIATVILAIVSTVIAIVSTRITSKEATRQIDEIRKSTEKQVEALKDIVAHQGDIEWGHLQHYYMQNKFELYEDQRELAVIQRKKSRDWTSIQELKTQEEWITLRIKNRKELLENYETLLKNLDISTESILHAES